MRRNVFRSLIVALSVLGGGAHAQLPFQLGLPNVNAPAGPEVSGVRISLLYGKNQTQRGLDLGVFSMSQTANFSGLGFVAGISRVTNEMSGGAMFSAVNVHTGRDSGLNGAFVNLLNNSDGAFNIGFVTIADGATLVDLGGFNMSKSSTAQIGFVNVTDRIESFQFGFLNMAKNGFLPIFPVINFPK